MQLQSPPPRTQRRLAKSYAAGQVKLQKSSAGRRRGAWSASQLTYCQRYFTRPGCSGTKNRSIPVYPRKLQTGEWAKGRRDTVWRKASHRDTEQRGGSCCENTSVAAAACLYWSQPRLFSHAERIEFQKENFLFQFYPWVKFYTCFHFCLSFFDVPFLLTDLIYILNVPFSLSLYSRI